MRKFEPVEAFPGAGRFKWHPAGGAITSALSLERVEALKPVKPNPCFRRAVSKSNA